MRCRNKIKKLNITFAACNISVFSLISILFIGKYIF